MADRLDQIAASATGGDSKFTLEEALASYSGMGYRKFELYSTGRGAALDMSLGLDYYREMAKKYGITYSSLHVAPIAEDLGETFDYAVKCACFAEELENPADVFNATAKAHYPKALEKFLAATEGRQFTPIIQIHVGAPSIPWMRLWPL
jgi:sugar phosphate isomerase/epimerase